MHNSAVLEHDGNTLPCVGKSWAKTLGLMGKGEADQFAVGLSEDKTIVCRYRHALRQGGHIPNAISWIGIPSFVDRVGDIECALEMPAFVMAGENQSPILIRIERPHPVCFECH